MVLLAVLAAGSAPSRQMLWCWYEACDVSFADTRSTGVAFLAAGVYLKAGSDVVINHRVQPVKTAPGAYRMAVVRIDFEQGTEFADPLRRRAAEIIVTSID